MINGVSIVTLNKLVKAGKLRQDELDTMIADRLEQKGYQQVCNNEKML